MISEEHLFHAYLLFYHCTPDQVYPLEKAYKSLVKMLTGQRDEYRPNSYWASPLLKLMDTFYSLNSSLAVTVNVSKALNYSSIDLSNRYAEFLDWKNRKFIHPMHGRQGYLLPCGVVLVEIYADFFSIKSPDPLWTIRLDRLVETDTSAYDKVRNLLPLTAPDTNNLYYRSELEKFYIDAHKVR